MALTVTQTPASSTGKQAWVVAQCTGDASYPTGGYTLTGALLNLPGGVSFGVAALDNPGADIVQGVHYDFVNGKLKFFGPTGAEVTNATNVGAVVANVIAFGGY